MSVKVTGVVAVPLLHILREFAATADLTRSQPDTRKALHSLRRGRNGKPMTTTDPEHGTQEWSEDPVGDLLKMYQTIKDAFEKITEDIKRFSEGLADLTHTLYHWKNRDGPFTTSAVTGHAGFNQKIRLNAVPLGTGTYLYKAKRNEEPC